jgi:hypothetical protein
MIRSKLRVSPTVGSEKRKGVEGSRPCEPGFGMNEGYSITAGAEIGPREDGPQGRGPSKESAG